MWAELLIIFIKHDITMCMIHCICGFTMDTHVICGEEMASKGQVAMHEASTYYADRNKFMTYTVLLISVSWMMLLDKHSLLVLV